MGTRTTVIDEDLVREVTAEPSGDALWVAGVESGWEAKPAARRSASPRNHLSSRSRSIEDG